LDNSGKAINDELFEEGTARNGIAGGLNVDYFEVGHILKFSDLKQGHDVGLFEFEDLEFSE
jgi:hypothetical protein